MRISLKAFWLSVLWVGLISCTAYFLLINLCRKFTPYLSPFVFLACTVLFTILFYLSAVHFRAYSLKLNNEKLLISSGFLIKRTKTLNLKYTASVKYISTPLMRLLKLSNLMLVFEGSVYFLPLLKVQDAELIFKSILKICDKNETI